MQSRAGVGVAFETIEASGVVRRSWRRSFVSSRARPLPGRTRSRTPRRVPNARPAPAASRPRSRCSTAWCTWPAWTSSCVALDGNVVLAKTITDGAGQAELSGRPGRALPHQDVTPGIRADRFAAVRRSRRGDGARPARRAVDLRAPTVEVRAPTSPTQSVQPVSTSDMLSGSVLDIAPLAGRRLPEPAAAPARHHPGTGRPPARERRPTDAGCAANQQHEPRRSIVGRLRSGAAWTEPRVGRAAGESVLGRVRPVFDERDAASHPAWHERVGGQARQPHAAVRQGILAASEVSNPGSPCAGRSSETGCFSPQDIQFRYVNDPVKSLPGEPDIQLTSFDSFTRIDGVVSPRHRSAGSSSCSRESSST